MTEDDTFRALQKPPTEDELVFGRNTYIYCNQHMRAHKTGWCTVSTRNKIKLDATTDDDAYFECINKKYPLFNRR